MKRRRVIITLEVETDAPIAVLRKAASWETGKGGGVRVRDLRGVWQRFTHPVTVLQAQANVIKE